VTALMEVFAPVRCSPGYRVYLAGRMVSVLGSAVSPIALAFAILAIGGGGTGLGLVLAAEYLAYLALMPVIGLITDRTGSLRTALVISQLLAATCQGIEAALIITGTAQIWSLALVASVGASAACLSTLTGTRIVRQLLEPALVHHANALLRSIQMGLAVLGPASAGVLVATLGPGPGIAWDAVTFLTAAALFTRLPSAPPDRPPNSPTAGGFRHGVRAYLSRPWLIAMSASQAVVDAAFMTTFILAPLVAARYLGGPAAWGTINAGLAAGSAIGAAVSLLIPVRRAGWTITAGSLAIALLPAALAARTTVPITLCCALAAGIGSGPGSVARRTAVQVLIPPGVLGRVSGHVELATGALIPLAYALAGNAADYAGPTPVIDICSLAIVASALAALLVPGYRRLVIPGADRRRERVAVETPASKR
jgi:hypothetical protein